MSCQGVLPPLDAAVFADTGWEPKAVYRHLDWLTAEAAKYGVPVHRVCAGNVREDALRYQVAYSGPMEERQLQRGETADGQTRWGAMPYFVLGPNGEKGMIRRQCTREYKLDPMRKWVRKFAGFPRYARIPVNHIEQWIGISADEANRMRSSGERWRRNWFPLIELEKTRAGCLEWMRENGYPQPPRSACIGCPYRSKAEWRWLRDEEPESFQEAIEFDTAIRKCGGMRGEVFLHSKRVSLSEVDFGVADDADPQLWIPGLCPACMT